MPNKPFYVKGLFLSVLSVFLLTACAGQPEVVTPYPFKTAKIVYKLSGDTTGTMTVEIKGDNARHEAHGLEGEDKVDTLVMELGEKIYYIDLNTKTGRSEKNPIHSELKALPANKRMERLEQIAIGVMAEDEMVEPKEEKEYAGQTCKLYEIEGVGETCLWNGIPLYYSVSIPQSGINSSSTATSIEVDTEISDTEFELPPGISITEIGN